MLHPVQQIARFLQTIGGALLSGGGLLWTPVLLLFGALHVLSGFFQAIQSLLQLWRGGGADAARTARLSGLARLLAGLLALLSLLPLLTFLSLLSLLTLLAIL